MCRLWSGWKRVLVLVQPETVVRWHRTGFKLYRKWLSRHRSCAGRKCVSSELRELIFRMVAENRTWGAPRIHGELTMLGFDISERNGFKVDAKGTEESGACETVESLLEQPPRSHRRHGLLHRPNANL